MLLPCWSRQLPAGHGHHHSARRQSGGLPQERAADPFGLGGGRERDRVHGPFGGAVKGRVDAFGRFGGDRWLQRLRLEHDGRNPLRCAQRVCASRPGRAPVASGPGEGGGLRALLRLRRSREIRFRQGVPDSPGGIPRPHARPPSGGRWWDHVCARTRGPREGRGGGGQAARRAAESERGARCACAGAPAWLRGTCPGRHPRPAGRRQCAEAPPRSTRRQDVMRSCTAHRKMRSTPCRSLLMPHRKKTSD
mmetsp:Transcript_89438/g.251889  ORF Transcript_89438/g.251889 Transcript_89438/m.251889 type:complete len:250 (+) Transcript_89438:717-1466(+)